MKFVYPVAALFMLAFPALPGDVHGHAVVTKRLSKKTVSPIVYNLRGAAIAPNRIESVNEYDRMVVILEPAKDTHPSPPKPPVTEVLAQEGGRFQPDFVVLPVGSTVEFPNLDPIFHNVFSLSKAQPFDLGYFPKGQSRTVKFNSPGVVQVYCHIHANMYAAIVVTASPWYQKPASDGSFSFSNVPPGRYRLTAWHKIAGLHKVDVDVPETGSAEVTIRVPVDTE
jgi:plastocyanin